MEAIDMTREAQRRHRWTEEEQVLLIKIVEEDLKELFEQAAAEGRPEADVWSLVPGKLGFFVSQEACHRKYVELVKLREAVEEAQETVSFEPLLEEMRRHRAVLVEMNQKLNVLLQIKEQQAESTLQTQVFLETIQQLFEKLLGELRLP